LSDRSRESKFDNTDALDSKADGEPSLLENIDSHTAVAIGEGRDFRVYIFGGFINFDFLSNRMFVLKPNCHKPNQSYDLSELQVNSTGLLSRDAGSAAPVPRYSHGMVKTAND